MGGVLPPPPSFTGPGSTYAEGEAKYPNMFNNGLIAVLSCEIYVGWVTFEREMYTEFIDARNRLDEETDRFSDLPKATNVAGRPASVHHAQSRGCLRIHRHPAVP